MNLSRVETTDRPERIIARSTLPERLGRWLFSLAVIGMGVELLVCSYLSGRGSVPRYKVIPAIPWPTAIPGFVFTIGVILVLCGVGFLIRRAATVASLVLGALMVLCALAFDVPRHPDLLSAPWRTNVLEPVVIGCLGWLGVGQDGIPGWLRWTGRYLLAFALIIFGIAHFQVLAFIAEMVPGWIPWHRFWTVFTGFAFIVAGASIATGLLARWALWCVGMMFAFWLLTIHLPPVLNCFHMPGVPQDPDLWSGVFIVAAFWGGSWMAANPLGREKRAGSESGLRLSSIPARRLFA